MKALHINVITKEITEIDLEDGLQPMYNALNCTTIEAVVPKGFPMGDFLYVDEEGLFKEPIGGFAVDGFSQTLFGHGLIVGSDYDSGEAADALMTVEGLKGLIEFKSAEELRGIGYPYDFAHH